MRRYWEEEGYEELDRLSADEKKRLEYETRLKYKRDKYAQLHYATRIGREEGEYLAVIQHEPNRLVYTKIVL